MKTESLTTVANLSNEILHHLGNTNQNDFLANRAYVMNKLSPFSLELEELINTCLLADKPFDDLLVAHDLDPEEKHLHIAIGLDCLAELWFACFLDFTPALYDALIKDQFLKSPAPNSVH